MTIYMKMPVSIRIFSSFVVPNLGMGVRQVTIRLHIFILCYRLILRVKIVFQIDKTLLLTTRSIAGVFLLVKLIFC